MLHTILTELASAILGNGTLVYVSDLIFCILIDLRLVQKMDTLCATDIQFVDVNDLCYIF